MTRTTGARAHWDAAFERRGAEGVSWHESWPRMSLEMIDALALARDDAIVDVGGGASALAGVLASRGFTDLTVVDISERALRVAREAMGAGSRRIDWVCADILEWEPERSFRLWHDRAVFHFLTDAPSRDRYVARAASAVREGGHLVIGVFAEDGPASCSGLPVARYSAAGISAAFGTGFSLSEERRDEHHTPGGAVQAFTWVSLRRNG